MGTRQPPARTPATGGIAVPIADGYDTFETIRQVLHRHAERADHLIPPFVMAAVCAADGRDALGRAPSLPPGQGRIQEVAPQDLEHAGAEDIATQLADTARILASRLTRTAFAASKARDRAALEEAAARAADVHRYLAGTG
jgi:hypothetical protein